MSATHLSDIDLKRLHEQGKRLILLDVDNTLVAWKSEEFDPRILTWIERAWILGFEICLLSNTHRPARLMRLCEKLGVETVRGRIKPSRQMFEKALQKYKRKREEAVMVGDQLLTDVWGANRAGVDAIWVKKMEGAEFAGTKLNRFLESILSGRIYRALVVTPEDLEAPVPANLPLTHRPIFRQFVKFCVVGGSSFLINYCIRMSLMFAAQSGGTSLSQKAGQWLLDNFRYLGGSTPTEAFLPYANAAGAAIAIVNSFIWNRLWTFSIRGKENRGEQFRRFIVVSLIGLVLDVVISTSIARLLPMDEKANLRVATIIAAGIVAVWNFSGQRMYAFKAKSS